MRTNPHLATIATLALAFDGGAIDCIILEKLQDNVTLIIITHNLNLAIDKIKAVNNC